MELDDEVRSIFDSFTSAECDGPTTTEEEASLIAQMSPAAFAVHTHLKRNLTTDGNDGKSVLLVLARPEDESEVTRGITRFFKIANARAGFRRVEILHADQGETAKRHSVNLKKLGSHIEDKDIICLVAAAPLDGPMTSLVDETIDLRSLAPEDLGAAFERAFPEASKPYGELAWPSGVPFVALNLACAKSADPASALKTLSSLQDGAGPSAATGVPEGFDLSDLHGYGEAGVWARALVDDLKSFQTGDLEWCEVGSAALIHGPPGTGKTELAKRIAGAAGIPLRTTSYSTWQRAGDGHLGSVISAIQADFDAARETSPSLLFIDEIDSLPARGTDSKNESWFWSIVNALLENLDGNEGRPGVFVLAACNHVARLDPALLRPGRLDRSIAIGLPAAPDLAEILSIKTGRVVDARNLMPMATLLAGSASGADATRIARLARRTARMANRDVTVADMEAAALPPDTRTPDELRRVALHEAGHAVTSMVFGRTPTRVALATPTNLNGFVEFENATGSATLQVLFEILVSLMAGRAAEQVILGAASAGAGGTSSSDLALATRLAETMVGTLGFGSSLMFNERPDRASVEAQLGRAYTEALSLIVRHKHTVEELADLLVGRRILTCSDLADFATRHTLTRDTRLDQRTSINPAYVVRSV